MVADLRNGGKKRNGISVMYTGGIIHLHFRDASLATSLSFMSIDYTLVLVATVLQFALGAVWYSPLLFGKWWMEIMECTKLSKAELQKMQKAMMPFYGLQLFLTFFTTVSFANLLPYIPSFTAYHTAFWIWIGFIAPVIISSVVWGNTKQKFWLKQISVMLGMNLVGIMIAAFVLSM